MAKDDGKTEESAEEVTAAEPEIEEDVNELSQAPVIDIEALLKPISEEAPSGESVRYSGVYDEINEARREDDNLIPNDWQTDLKRADYRKVVDLALPVIETQSKDLQVAAWLSEALVNEHGFAGLRDSMKLLSKLQEKFWDTLFPEIDEGDMEGRANALEWMDQKVSFALKRAPITQGDGYGYFGWEDSKKFVFPDNIESLTTEEQESLAALKKQAEKEHRVTENQWNKAVSQSKRAFYEELDFTIQECFDEFEKLNLVIEKSFEAKQTPGLREIPAVLEVIRMQTNKLLEQKRLEEPDPIDEEEASEGTDSSGTGNKRNASGVINDRKDALKRLAQLASFFRKTEPHSPVSYLVNRAVKWGNMPLDAWLEDVIKDDGTLSQLRQTLGFNTEGAENEMPSMENPVESFDAPNAGETNPTEENI